MSCKLSTSWSRTTTICVIYWTLEMWEYTTGLLQTSNFHLWVFVKCSHHHCNPKQWARAKTEITSDHWAVVSSLQISIPWSTAKGRLHPIHHGFFNNTFILQCAIEKAKSMGQTLYVAAVDITNAFPSTDCATLQLKLKRLGMSGRLFEWIWIMSDFEIPPTADDIELMSLLISHHSSHI